VAGADEDVGTVRQDLESVRPNHANATIDVTLEVMRLDPYRRVLARPGVRSLTVVALLARIPVTAAPVVLTLHVVLGLHLGFTQSGVVAAVVAIGAAVGSPLVGRAIDRVGLRPVLLVTTAASGAFWLTAGWLPYRALLVSAAFGGLLSLPVFALARQALAALLPPEERQAGYALDSMSVELSFAVGPAMGVVLITQAGSHVAFAAAGVLIVLAGLALVVLDPPVHGEEGVAPTAEARRRAPRAAVPLRSWFGLRALVVMFATFGATFTLSGTDVALTAVMRSFDELSLLGLVIAIWCLASLVGGFVYGAAHRQLDPLVLLALLAGLTVPVALATSWQVLAVLVVPSGVFCAPLISATAEQLARIAPTGARGQAMGVHGSALTMGNALGAPFVGLVVDNTSARAGFAGVGLAGLALALAALLAQAVRLRRSPAGPRPAPAPSEQRSPASAR
jgi:MFS family permease